MELTPSQFRAPSQFVTPSQFASEPAIALCGFDKPEPRTLHEGANFVRVIECGLGATIHDFDLIHIHNFPGRTKATEIWKDAELNTSRPNPKIARILLPPNEVCGALAIETARKSVSTSFIGAMASAVVFGEILRGFHKGLRHDEIFLSPRNMIDCEFGRSGEPYSSADAAKIGFADIASQS